MSAPDAGDIVWVDFTPQTGKEGSGKRPALVLTPHAYNEKVGLMIACPITSKIKGYPFEIVLPNGLAVSGAVLSDQVKSLDYRSRGTTIVGRVPSDVMAEVRAKLKALLEIT